MNLKIIKILSIFVIFLLGFITHFIYDIFPNTITSFFFPVNESIFEHLKIIYVSYLLWALIEYFLLKKESYLKNFPSSLFLSIIFNMIILLAIYIPIYNTFGHNIYITLLIYLISIAISQIISYYILKSNNDFKFLNKYAYIFLLILIMVLIYLTYYPPNIDIFIDKMNNKKGLNNIY